MASFDNGVSPPGGASFNAPLLNFSAFGDLYNDYQQSKLTDQQKQLNQVKIDQGKQQIDLAKAFAGGLPTDPATGQIDYRKAAAILASKGDIGGAVNLLQSQPAPASPMFGGGQPQGGAPQGQPQQPAPAAVQARPLPPPRSNSPQGDSGQGTLTSLVTDRLPAQNQTTGATIMKIAQVMGVDPNADLTAGQQRRAQGLLQKYAPEIAGPAMTALPPSANAGSAAPQVTRQPPSAQGGAAQPQQQPQQQQQPLVPQEPLPPGYSDPMKAVSALRAEAARYGAMQNGKDQEQRLDAWADRIEAGLKPVSVGTNTSLVDPRTGRPVYEGAGAAAIRSGTAGTAVSLDADAENYRQTGKLPPNMGRGVQGQAESLRIRERAAELEAEDGGNTSDWPTRWQKFGAQATGRRALENRAAGLELAENEATTLLPRVREASAKVSRTQYPSINSLIEAAQKGTGGTDVIKLGIAVESLVPVYARVLKPTGQIGQGDMARAHDILDKAWSDGQIGAALDQMQVELKSARTALDKTLGEFGAKPKKDEGASPSGGAKKDADGWTTLPNGARIREIKADGS